MASTQQQVPQDVPGLLALLSSTKTLVSAFLNALSPSANVTAATAATASNPTSNNSSVPGQGGASAAEQGQQATSNKPNPLDVLHDSGKLLKAQTTKLSLLALNKPFTPSAIGGIVRDVAATCLPAMMAAVELCHPRIWGATMRAEVIARVRRCLREVVTLLEDVEGVASTNAAPTAVSAAKIGGAATSTAGKAGGASRGVGAGGQSVGLISRAEKDKTSSRDTLAATGIVWSACDALMELKALGVVGLVVQKAQQYRDTLKDAVEELKEWSEEADEDEDEDDDDDDSDDDAGVLDGNAPGPDQSEQEELDALFGTANKLAHGNEALRTALADALKKLKLIVTLYEALIKRRLKTFSTGQSSATAETNLKAENDEPMARLSQLMAELAALPDAADELASAFYDLDKDRAVALLTEIMNSASVVAGSVQKNWNDAEDVYTTWSINWQKAIRSEPLSKE